MPSSRHWCPLGLSLLMLFIFVSALPLNKVDGFTIPNSSAAANPKRNRWASTSPSSPKTSLPWVTRSSDVIAATSSTSTKLVTSTTALKSFVAPEIWTSVLPTALGFYKSEYGFSYAYGFGTAISALSVLKRFNLFNSGPAFLKFHALAIVFYGLRLNLFLFIRTFMSQRQRDMIARIEEKALKRGNRFKTRLPVLLSTGLLYYALVAPAILTAKLVGEQLLEGSTAKALKILIGVMWFGFGVAAIGDFTKTYVKYSENDENYLVTSGIFSLLRHPNYTGEMIGWTANSLCGIIAAAELIVHTQGTFGTLSSIESQLMGQGLGWVGIFFVLLRASTSLEKRQKESYGDNPKYQDWVKSSWKGFTLPEPRKEAAPEAGEANEIEMNDVDEGGGSGI